MTAMPPELENLRASLRAFRIDAHDPALVDAFVKLADEGRSAFERSRLLGHFTGSSWLVSRDGRYALLMHHRKLDRWLQPGGHADGDMDLARVALREACEETGVPGLQVEGNIFDLDRHRIPARGTEPEHWHYDVRYVVRACETDHYEANDESHALAWRDIAQIAVDPSLDPSLQRMARRWLTGHQVLESPTD